MSDIEKFRNPNAQADGCGLNQLLDQLGSEGSHHSEGTFTLSLENALEKLRQFQLADANFYVLNLVSVAALVGATKFSVLLGKSQDTIEFDGRSFTRSELENIFVSEDPAVKELAVALTAVKGLGYESINFQSAGGLFWKDKTPEFHDAGLGSNTLTLAKKPVKKMFRELPNAWEKVWSERSEAALRRSCQLAPLYIKFNHRQVNKNMVHIEAPAVKVEHSDLKLLPIVKFGRKECEIVTLPSNGRYSAIICADIDEAMKETRAPKRVQHWHFVFRGVSYTRTSEQLNMVGLGGIVISDGFSKDISHTDIVENEFFQKIVQNLQDVLVTYVKEHLTRHALQRNEARNWFEATTLVGEILGKAGDKREAARVDAWTYGHRAKLKLLAPEDCRQLVCKYDQPLVFLLDYFYWNSLLAVEQQLQTLSGNGGRSGGFPVADEMLLVPWIKGAQTDSLVKLFEFLLRAFPLGIKWDTLVPLEKSLASELTPEDFRERFLAPLVNRFESITSRVEDMESLCQVASYLHTQGYLNFEVWLEKAFASGLVASLPHLRARLRRLVHWEQAEAVLQRLDTDKRRAFLMQADAAFGHLMLHPKSSNTDIRNRLVSALELTDVDGERAELLALLCLVDSPSKEHPGPTTGAWQTHRAALVCVNLGCFGEARILHESAHQALQEHWFSHLLMGDISLAANERRRAHKHYVKSFDLRPSTATQEAVIETSDMETQQEQWLSLARSLSANKLESYFAYREALELPVLRDFPSWVKLEALTSYAELLAGNVPKSDGSMSALSMSLRSPSAVRARVRNLRRNGQPSQASQELAGLRLAYQLSQSVPLKLRWKEEFQDSEPERPAETMDRRGKHGKAL